MPNKRSGQQAADEIIATLNRVAMTVKTNAIVLSRTALVREMRRRQRDEEG